MRTRFNSSLIWVVAFFMTVVFSSCRSDIETVIYAVRHTEKVITDDRDPPLTEEGHARARVLADLLEDKNINFIFSSDYRRTQDTAFPLAERLAIDVRNYDHKDFSSLIKFIRKNRGSNFLVVGHSNSTPALVNQLIGQETYPSLDETDYTKIYTVFLKGGQAEAQVTTF